MPNSHVTSSAAQFENPEDAMIVVNVPERDGAVTDFIDLPLWPTFNLADVSIVLGVLLLLLFDLQLSEGRRKG